MHSSFFDERIRMYRYYFKLANLVIQINAPFVIEKFYEMEIYRIEYAEKINAQYNRNVSRKLENRRKVIVR